MITEITKDSASEANFSEDDFVDGRRNPRGVHHGGYDQRSQPMRGQDPRRMDRGRGGPPPHGPAPHERYVRKIWLKKGVLNSKWGIFFPVGICTM